MNGQIRFVTHADLTDSEIDTALERIGPVDGTVAARAPRRPAHPV
jgi:threonine aldolase